MLVQEAFAVGVLVNIQKLKVCFYLTCNLLIYAVRKLDGAIVFFKAFHLAGICKRVEGEKVGYLSFILILKYKSKQPRCQRITPPPTTASPM